MIAQPTVARTTFGFAPRLAWSALLGLAWMLGASASAHADVDSLCGPFEQPKTSAQVIQLAQFDVNGAAREAGISAPDTTINPTTGNGRIVELSTLSSLAGLSAGLDPGPEFSEALLALPKNSAGAIPTDFELGPGARISQSFFSPVLCATLARVTGPAGATLEQLVTLVPDGSVVVPNDVYASAAAEIHPAQVTRETATRNRPRVRPLQNPDPYAPLQYGLAISGVRAARGLSAGAGVTIALLDSTPDERHQDLVGMSIQPLPGRDSPFEPGVHGTLMAGVISAVEGNGFGIAGLAPEAKLVAIPICTPTGSAGGSCTIFDLLQGLDIAWSAEVDLVNLSLSGPPNPLLERGVARLEALGVVVIAAAGNEGVREKRYPAAYPSVVGVGAIDRIGSPFVASNYGDWVEIFAPGVEVLSTVPGNAFAFGSGTSLAAAHVTGALAILTAATGDAKLARAELFRAASSKSGKLRVLPDVCEVLQRLQLDCTESSGDSAGRWK